VRGRLEASDACRLPAYRQAGSLEGMDSIASRLIGVSRAFRLKEPERGGRDPIQAKGAKEGNPLDFLMDPLPWDDWIASARSPVIHVEGNRRHNLFDL
jgi:hypothetical protein